MSLGFKEDAISYPFLLNAVEGWVSMNGRMTVYPEKFKSVFSFLIDEAGDVETKLSENEQFSGTVPLNGKIYRRCGGIYERGSGNEEA